MRNFLEKKLAPARFKLFEKLEIYGILPCATLYLEKCKVLIPLLGMKLAQNVRSNGSNSEYVRKSWMLIACRSDKAVELI